jgi:mannitol-1-phosphate 5-dehydrogenase
MLTIDNKKLVIFGAGKIGRSFIAQLFSRGGYEIVFVDISKSLIDELNIKRGYRIVIKGDHEQVINIENVRGVSLCDEQTVINEVASAGIIATSVGLSGLQGIFPVLASALQKRFNEIQEQPLDIIIAENMRNADRYFRKELMNLLPAEYPFDSLVGLVETSIGKMVPIMNRKDIEEDMLQIFAEPYNTLILNRKGFRNKVPDIEGLAPKDNMKAWVDRKLFIHNLGHSASAYIGYLYNPEFIFLWEALAVPEIHDFVRAAMLQSSEILLKEYPEEFTVKNLTEHIDDLLSRFQNKALGDTIFRVGCDLKRKLGPEDRLAGAIHKSFKTGLPFDRILFALVCGCHFRASDEEKKMLPDDIDFENRYGNDVNSVMSCICGFDKIKQGKIIEKACSLDRKIRSAGLLETMMSIS